MHIWTRYLNITDRRQRVNWHNYFICFHHQTTYATNEPVSHCWYYCLYFCLAIALFFRSLATTHIAVCTYVLSKYTFLENYISLCVSKYEFCPLSGKKQNNEVVLLWSLSFNIHNIWHLNIVPNKLSVTMSNHMIGSIQFWVLVTNIVQLFQHRQYSFYNCVHSFMLKCSIWYITTHQDDIMPYLQDTNYWTER